MRRLVTWTVVASLAGSVLAGCGQAGPSGSAGPAGVRRAAGALHGLAQEASLARRFYERMKPTYAGKVAIVGDRVTLSYPDQPASVYDFTDTPRTGQVLVSIGEFRTAIAVADLLAGAADEGPGAEVLPALLVPIALDMAAAGGQALVLYWLGHRGDEFDKGDAAKCVALAMALAIVPFLGEMSALGHILPVAVKLVASSNGFAAREVMRAAAALSGEILELVKFLIKLRKARQGGEGAPGII